MGQHVYTHSSEWQALCFAGIKSYLPMNEGTETETQAAFV